MVESESNCKGWRWRTVRFLLQICFVNIVNSLFDIVTVVSINLLIISRSFTLKPPQHLHPTLEVGFEQPEGPLDVSEILPKSAPKISDDALKRIRKLEQQIAASRSAITVTISNFSLPPFDPSSEFADPEGWSAIVDLWVAKHKPDTMELIMLLSKALKGEAANLY